jgi:hypothetical protein
MFKNKKINYPIYKYVYKQIINNRRWIIYMVCHLSFTG